MKRTVGSGRGDGMKGYISYNVTPKDAFVDRTVRVGCFVAGSLFFQQYLLGQSSSIAAQPCDVAQVLSVRGHWIADPGARGVSQWDCLHSGDDVHIQAPETPQPTSAPAKAGKKKKEASDSPPPPAPEGEITIIYKFESIPPYHLVCNSTSPCQNAYKVLSAAKTNTPSVLQDILDIFFSRPKPKVVPGILTGWYQPVDVRTEHSKIFRDGFHGWSAKSSPSLGDTASHTPVIATPIVLCSDAGNIDIRQIPLVAREGTTEVNISRLGEDRTADLTTPTVDINPSNLFMIRTTHHAAMALIEPRESCAVPAERLRQAIALTESWPSSISEDTKNDFLTLFLQNLARTNGN